MLDSKIPILSIREPYATLIIEGKKDIELRNWKPPAWAKEFYIHVPTIADLEKCREYNIIPNPPRTIIGKATITDVKYYNTPNEFAKDYPRHYHKLFWKYNYGFILDNLEKIQPIYDIPGGHYHAQITLSSIDWYNNGKKISTTKCYPEERYSGHRDDGWYVRFLKALKLEHMLPVPVAVRG